MNEGLFWAKVDVGVSGLSCWNWTASKHPKGYGQFRTATENNRAHRFAYELLVGPIPAGLVLDHLCRNRACVNPDHLEPVTQAENLNRSRAALTAASAQAARTHCPKGHEYSEENTRMYRGVRHCRACGKIRSREHRALAVAEGLTVRAWHKKHRK